MVCAVFSMGMAQGVFLILRSTWSKMNQWSKTTHEELLLRVGGRQKYADWPSKQMEAAHSRCCCRGCRGAADSHRPILIQLWSCSVTLAQIQGSEGTRTLESSYLSLLMLWVWVAQDYKTYSTPFASCHKQKTLISNRSFSSGFNNNLLSQRSQSA